MKKDSHLLPSINLPIYVPCSYPSSLPYYSINTCNIILIHSTVFFNVLLVQYKWDLLLSIVYLRIININLVNYLFFNCICELIHNGDKRYIIKHDITSCISFRNYNSLSVVMQMKNSLNNLNNEELICKR